jgi:hypothetical protein
MNGLGIINRTGMTTGREGTCYRDLRENACCRKIANLTIGIISPAV